MMPVDADGFFILQQTKGLSSERTHMYKASEMLREDKLAGKPVYLIGLGPTPDPEFAQSIPAATGYAFDTLPPLSDADIAELRAAQSSGELPPVPPEPVAKKKRAGKKQPDAPVANPVPPDAPATFSPEELAEIGERAERGETITEAESVAYVNSVVTPEPVAKEKAKRRHAKAKEAVDPHQAIKAEIVDAWGQNRDKWVAMLAGSKMQEADADDVISKAIVEVSKDLDKFIKAKGTTAAKLTKIIQSRAIDLQRSQDDTISGDAENEDGGTVLDTVEGKKS